MNCCDGFGNCRQGRDCPVRRQAPYPATLPPDLPVWPDRDRDALWRRRLQELAFVAGHAAVAILMLVCAAMAAAGWVQLLIS